jgi:hypothetical protein
VHDGSLQVVVASTQEAVLRRLVSTSLPSCFEPFAKIVAGGTDVLLDFADLVASISGYSGIVCVDCCYYHYHYYYFCHQCYYCHCYYCYHC